MSRQALRKRLLLLGLTVLAGFLGLGSSRCNPIKTIATICPCGIEAGADGNISCKACSPTSSPSPSTPSSPTPTTPTTTPVTLPLPPASSPSPSPSSSAGIACPTVPPEITPGHEDCQRDSSEWSGDFNAAIEEVCAEHGLSGCVGGGVRWPLPWKDYVTELQAKLLARGFCSGHDYDSADDDPEPGPNPSAVRKGFGSEMGIRRAGTTAREEFFAPLSTAKKIRAAPGAFTGSCSPAVEPFPFRTSSGDSNPSLASGPAPGPAPATGPSPVIPRCLLPRGEGRFVVAAIENIGRPPVSQQISVSTKWCSEVEPRDPETGRISPPGWPFVGPAGSCGTKCCRIGAHEGELGIACENEQFGAPSWSVSGGDLRLVPTDNPFNVKVAEGAGTVRVCGSALPRVCAEATVRAQVGPVVAP